MDIRVRVGTRDDIGALVEVECSDVETWYRFSAKGRGEPASYDELSSWERTMHGGPWMDRTGLTRYWGDIERLGIIPLVAELDGKVVGHLDVIITDELPLGHFLYLDVLGVHQAYRRRGVATALIREAERLARDREVAFMLVQPQQFEGPSGLTYRSCGFEKAFEAYNLEIAVNRPEMSAEAQIASIPHTQEAPVRTHSMVCGWYNTSLKTWYYGVNPNLEHLRALSSSALALCALIRKSAYFLHLQHSLFDQSKGGLCLWAPVPPNEEELQTAFEASEIAARWLGIETLTTKTIEGYVSTLERVGFKVKSKTEPYLAKKISNQGFNPTLFRKEAMPSETMEGF